MEKYRKFTSITEKYLNGKLVGLQVEYPNDSKVHVLVSYECNNFYTLDYELEVDTNTEEVHFLSHGSTSGYGKISLGSEPSFDGAVSELLFSH